MHSALLKPLHCARAAQIEALFDTLDAEGDGALDIDEVKKTLAKLRAESEASAAELKEKSKEAERSRRAAAKQQAILMARRAKDEADALKEAEEEKEAKGKERKASVAA